MCAHTEAASIIFYPPHYELPHSHVQLFCKLFVHTVGRPSSLVSCVHTVQCMYVCVCVWMIDLATQMLSKTILQILLMHSLWNQRACLIQRKIEEVEYDLHPRASAHALLRDLREPAGMEGWDVVKNKSSCFG